jgi:hypothetical protein
MQRNRAQRQRAEDRNYKPNQNSNKASHCVNL